MARKKPHERTGTYGAKHNRRPRKANSEKEVCHVHGCINLTRIVCTNCHLPACVKHWNGYKQNCTDCYDGSESDIDPEPETCPSCRFPVDECYCSTEG